MTAIIKINFSQITKEQIYTRLIKNFIDNFADCLTRTKGKEANYNKENIAEKGKLFK